jgi:hypothetical protein
MLCMTRFAMAASKITHDKRLVRQSLTYGYQ